MSLERDQARLVVSLQDRGIEVPVVEMDNGGSGDRSTAVDAKVSKQSVGRSGSLRWRDYGGRSDDEQEAVSTCEHCDHGIRMYHQS